MGELYVCYDKSDESAIAYRSGYIYMETNIIASTKDVMEVLSERYGNIKLITLSEFKELGLKGISVKEIKSVKEFDKI